MKAMSGQIVLVSPCNHSYIGVGYGLLRQEVVQGSIAVMLYTSGIQPFLFSYPEVVGL
jgi:hypothetical protein